MALLVSKGAGEPGRVFRGKGRIEDYAEKSKPISTRMAFKKPQVNLSCRELDRQELFHSAVAFQKDLFLIRGD